MTRKEFNRLMGDKFGRTRAEWQMYISGMDWDGCLYHKAQLYDVAVPGITYTIVPYYGGLYQTKTNSFGSPINIIIK